MPHIQFKLPDLEFGALEHQAKANGKSVNVEAKAIVVAALSGGGEGLIGSTGSAAVAAGSTPVPPAPAESLPSGVRRGIGKSCPRCGSMSTHFRGCPKGSGPV